MESKAQFRRLKWSNYDAIYDRHLPGKIDSVLEIGVAGGGSLVWWKNRFPNAKIYGVDIDTTCKKMEQHGFSIGIGNQCDAEFLKGIGDNFDVIVDDGGHRPYQIYASFKALWPKLNKGGLYIIEDVQMAMKWRWRIWSKLFNGPRLIVDQLYEQMNRYVRDEDGVAEKSPAEVHLYPHMIVIRKGSIKTEVKEFLEVLT